MENFGSKQILAKNLLALMEKSGKTRRDVCNDLGFNYFTFSDWVKGKKYPRIDKLQLLAAYFHVKKSDLIEYEFTTDEDKNSIISSAACRMAADDTFLTLIHRLTDLDPEQIHKVNAMLDILIGE